MPRQRTLSQRWQPRAWISGSDPHRRPRRNQVPLRQNDL